MTFDLRCQGQADCLSHVTGVDVAPEIRRPRCWVCPERPHLLDEGLRSVNPGEPQADYREMASAREPFRQLFTNPLRERICVLGQEWVRFVDRDVVRRERPFEERKPENGNTRCVDDPFDAECRCYVEHTEGAH